MADKNKQISENPLENLIHAGKVESITLPSGKKVTIREYNGEDEGLISTVKSLQDNSYLCNFLAAIVQKDSTAKKVSSIDIAEWLSNDRLKALFNSRILSLGNIFKFTHICSNPDCRDCKAGKLVEYEEDLTPYLSGIPDYPNGSNKEVELVLSSTKKIKYSLLTSALETTELETAPEAKNLNTNLITRKLSIFNAGNWVPLAKFMVFSAKDMAEIRASIRENDPFWSPTARITCASCGMKTNIQLLTDGNFFYPTVI